LNNPGYVFLYAVKFGALISNLVTGLLRSRVKRLMGGNDDVIWERALAYRATRAACAVADGDPVSHLNTHNVHYRHIIHNKQIQMNDKQVSS
jgi:hypothetical protein